MKICRFNDDRPGLVEGDEVIDVSAALDVVPAVRWPLPHGDLLIAHLAEFIRRIEAVKAGAPRHRTAAVRLKSPVANPSKIIAAPVNYQKHIDESRADPGIHFGSEVKAIDHYGVFLKSSTSLVGPGDGVALPKVLGDRRMDHEVEVTCIIGREAYRVSRAEALDYVAGYTIGLDMSVRGTEDRSWRKSFDSAAVLGPWLVTPDEVGDPADLDFSIEVNGTVRQASNTKYLIFDIPRLIEYASATYRLYPGDVILTGTPEGVGPVAPGDVMVAKVKNIGAMTVAVGSS